MIDLNRRDFIMAAAAGVCLACLGADANAAQESSILDVGTPTDYPNDGLYDAKLKSDKVAILRKNGRILAISGVCTHKSCTLKVQEGQFRCPCHRSTFNDLGNPTGGPAKAALFRHAISLNDAGHLIVDKSKKFGPQQWDDPATFVNVS